MKVLKAIENKSNFVISQNGKILGISNGNILTLGKNSKLSKKEILDMDIVGNKKIDGVINDIFCIRV